VKERLLGVILYGIEEIKKMKKEGKELTAHENTIAEYTDDLEAERAKNLILEIESSMYY